MHVNVCGHPQDNCSLSAAVHRSKDAWPLSTAVLDHLCPKTSYVEPRRDLTASSCSVCSVKFQQDLTGQQQMHETAHIVGYVSRLVCHRNVDCQHRESTVEVRLLGGWY